MPQPYFLHTLVPFGAVESLPIADKGHPDLATVATNAFDAGVTLSTRGRNFLRQHGIPDEIPFSAEMHVVNERGHHSKATSIQL